LRPSPFREGAAEAVEALPRRRKGKVAQLSKEVRDRLNQMLLDGVPYEDIISRLGKKGAALNKVNLHSWFVGGHQDWLKEQRLLEECRLRQELTLDFAREEQGLAPSRRLTRSASDSSAKPSPNSGRILSAKLFGATH